MLPNLDYPPYFQAPIQAYLGDREASAQILSRWLASRGTSAPDDMYVLAMFLETAVLVGDQGAAERIAGWLLGAPSGWSASGVAASLARLLGAAAALAGDRERALACYQEGLDANARIGARPEVALAHLGLAEVLLDDVLTPTRSQRDSEQALEHLDTAIEEFRAMNMQPSLERALRHKGLRTA